MVKKISKDEDIDIDDNDINVDLLKQRAIPLKLTKPSGRKAQNLQLKSNQQLPLQVVLEMKELL